MIRFSKPVQAFSLIEMLVVISIITLLISITLPSLSKSRKTARSTICQSNQHQMTIAFTSYTDDSGGSTFPIIHQPNLYWFGRLHSYWQDDRVMICPETTKAGNGGYGSADERWGPGGGWMDGLEGSYGMNLWLLPDGAFATDINMTQSGYWHHMDSTPSSVPVFADSPWVGSWPDHEDVFPTNLYVGDSTHAQGHFMGRFVIDRHTHAINVSFRDCSSRLVQLEELWRLKWNRIFQPGDPVYQ